MTVLSGNAAVHVQGGVTPVLAVERLEVTYHRVAVAVQGVSLEVPPNGVVAVLGTNGAGKTTTLRAISGFLPSDHATITAGEVYYLGSPLKPSAPHEMARRGFALIPERDKVFTTMTVVENLRCVPKPRDREQRWTIDRVMELFPSLARRSGSRAGFLSGGERQMLAVGKALMLEPEVVLADELSLGVAPIVVAEVMDVLRRINAETGTAVLLVEQNATAALNIADYVYVMESGRIVYEGTPAELRASADVQEFYLGLGADSDAGAKSYADVKQYRRKRRWT